MKLSHNIVYRDAHLIYSLNMLNQSDKTIRGISLKIAMTEGLSFIEGAIKRERGMMDIEEIDTDLIIGNLSSNEAAKVIIEFKIKDKNVRGDRPL